MTMRKMTRQVKDMIKLEKEIKDYGNKMFLTVNYSVNVHEYNNKTGERKSREEYRFQLVVRGHLYKRIKHWWREDDRFESKPICKEFTMAQVAECRKYWLKVRNATLPEPEWEQW